MDEVSEIGSFIVAIESLRSMMETKSNEMTKEEKKCAKMAITYCDKYLAAAAERRPEPFARLLGLFKGVAVSLQMEPKNKWQIPTRNLNALDVHMFSPAIIDAECTICKRKPVDIEVCDFRRIMKKFEVPGNEEGCSCEYGYRKAE